MDDWQTKTKGQKKRYLELANGLYSVNPPANDVKPPKRRKVKRSTSNPSSPSESAIQSSLIKWARLQRIPLISIPNHGKRSAWSGKREVAMGLTRGVSDLFLARASQNFHGMWIELKAKGRLPTNEQYDWLGRMGKEGYMTGWYDNLDDAMAAINKYLEIST